MTRILIVDDDPQQLHQTAEMAERAGFRVLTVGGGAEALSALRGDREIGAMVLDLVMPDIDGMSVLEAMAREGITTPVIVQTATSSLETVVSAMRLGAADYFVKPVAPERLLISLRNVLRLDALETSVRNDVARRDGLLTFSNLVASAPSMRRVAELGAKAARSDIPVLVEGESGVGKQTLARVIHGSGSRSGKPFIAINCAALPPDQLETLLFGQKAKPGTEGRPGKIVEAHGGTLFLDEIGELPRKLQDKLLTLLERQEVDQTGASSIQKVDVRIIAATTRRLLNLAKAGDFREDLYYRLNVFPIYVPPLRERREDLPALVDLLSARFAAEASKRVLGITPNALELLLRQEWAGNIAQLEALVFRAVVLTEGPFLDMADFPQLLVRSEGRASVRDTLMGEASFKSPAHIDRAPARVRAPEAAKPEIDRFLDDEGQIAALADIEREAIMFAIERCGGHMSRVARALGIGRSTLYRKLNEYGLANGLDKNAA
ncbi:sigma-54-dependent Fis family transcriptional regulator [Devosia pacifica]|uniref:DNA-binding transcriptional regulator NtrC n=1 Tax=Devosia pacifica TaxID=1335967 RepID=A0A918SFG0_9HYPH|nr:sigma-54 dependent transcriptional regulator [Devosia pacifica]GHA38211.1 sigma-54-dependent Fis family transcriptional regulator [Devosia pacifica]